jgi:hypothetical protein
MENRRVVIRDRNRKIIKDIFSPGGLVKRIMNQPLKGCSDEAMPGRAVISFGSILLQSGVYVGAGYAIGNKVGATIGGIYSACSIVKNLIINSSPASN